MTIEPDTPPAIDIRRLKARIHRPVVLVGMMGVGKSTVGRRLGEILRLPFADADSEIELAARMSVNEIFAEFGEAYFRDGERRVIDRLLDAGPGVIATGGGAFVQPDTRDLILQKGVAVWLDSDVATLAARVSRKDTRPLLRGGDPTEIIARLKAERDGYYALAPIKVFSDSAPHAETANRILKELDSWL